MERYHSPTRMRSQRTEYSSVLLTNRDRAVVAQCRCGTEFEATEHVQLTGCVVDCQRARARHRQVASNARRTDVQDTGRAVHGDVTIAGDRLHAAGGKAQGAADAEHAVVRHCAADRAAAAVKVQRAGSVRQRREAHVTRKGGRAAGVVRPRCSGQCATRARGERTSTRYA